MEAIDVNRGVAQIAGITFHGKILVVDGGAEDLEAYSSSFRQEGFEVRSFASYAECLACLESEYFDLVMVMLRKVPSLEDEKIWSVRSRTITGGLSWFWHGVSICNVTLMWRTWELWSN